MRRTRLIVFELNEVPFRVFDDFVKFNPDSNFAKLKSFGAQYTAYTPDVIHLHPKICWPTFHLGVNDAQHGILEYNATGSYLDSHYPRFWDILRAEGFTIGIGASIGSSPIPKNRDNIVFYLPDMFAPDSETIPAILSTFQRFNIRSVANSARVVRQGLPIKDTINFCSSMMSLGIRTETIATIARQLVSEGLDRKKIVRRRTIQGLLTFDIVARCISKTKPDLATFFTNHVASSMHRYWAAAYPKDYKVNNFGRDWIEAYGNEIGFAMSQADVMLGQTMKIAKEYNYTLLLITGMGQARNSAEPVTNELVLGDPKALFGMIGIPEKDWYQVGGMVPYYNFQFSGHDQIERAKTHLSKLFIRNEPIAFTDLGDSKLDIGIQGQNWQEEERILFGNQRLLAEQLGLRAEKIQDQAGSTGSHIPDGLAVVYKTDQDLAKFGNRRKISNTRVTSSLLAAFGVETPSYMQPCDEEFCSILVH